MGCSLCKSKKYFHKDVQSVRDLSYEEDDYFEDHYSDQTPNNSGAQLQIMKEPAPIRWRKGELIGAGAYGRVYMGMNLESGELIAVKQVLIAQNGVSKDKAQTHIRGLEEEVKVLRNLSHPNIVRYLGTDREEDALNIFLEFVPGGSIASLINKFGCFTENVIKTYTRQLLLGLQYLHKHAIMHRDIKGANILVDNNGCIKLADFGASKKLADLATMSDGYRSMKGTPYWMAPEVIKQTGHGRQADIWSVGCTVYEMATGKPPWSEYQSQVAALFHIASAKTPPPMPANLSPHAADFLLQCLQRDPRERPSATELLKHPFLADPSLASENERSSAAQRDESRRSGSSIQSSHHRGTSWSHGKVQPVPRRGNKGDGGHPIPTPSPDKRTPKPCGSPRRVLQPRQNLNREQQVSRDSNPRKSSLGPLPPGPSVVSVVQRDRWRSEESEADAGVQQSFRGRQERSGAQTSGRREFSTMSIRSNYNPMEEPSYIDDGLSPLQYSRGSDEEVTGPRATRETPSPMSRVKGETQSECSKEEEEEEEEEEGEEEEGEGGEVEEGEEGEGEEGEGGGGEGVGEDSGRMALGESYSAGSMPSSGEGGGAEGYEEVSSARVEAEGEGGADMDGLGLGNGEDFTEDRIKMFLEEKANELKRMQTPLLEELTSLRGVDETSPSSPDGEGRSDTAASPSPSAPSHSPNRAVGMRPSLISSQRASWEAELQRELASKRAEKRRQVGRLSSASGVSN